MVGSLARLLLKSEMLTPEAKRLFEEHREKLTTGYVSYNNLAPAIELVYALERAKEIAKTLLDRGIEGENVPVEPRKARVSATLRHRGESSYTTTAPTRTAK